MSVLRRPAALLGALAVLLSVAAPAAAQAPVLIAEVRYAAGTQQALTVSPGPCQDSAFKLIGGRWPNTYNWSFQRSSTPGYLDRTGTAQILKRSFDNITGANNDCGRADSVGASHAYLGKTTRSPNCRSRDGFNVIGFGRLEWGVLAVTCFWQSGDGQRIVEADVKINTRETWALSLGACQGDTLMLESVMTHEAGHVFGLDHIAERRHGRLTMSPFIDGPCENDEATLGRGDMLGLERLY